jgi:pyruvate dehydrogenase E1 component alpha subunit
VHGHFEGDAQKYRSADELMMLGELDPLKKAEHVLERLGVSAESVSAIKTDVQKQVDAAIELAKAGSQPVFADAARDVYTPAARD